jgi:hypothetical protein
MVLAAPVFILSQTAAFRTFYAANREPLLRLALGSTIAYLSLRLLSKGYEAAQLAEDLERASRWRAHVEASLLRPDFVSATAARVRASSGSGGEAALREALAGALDGAAGALAQAAAAARQRSAWMVGLEQRMPVSGVLEGGRARAEAAAAEARAQASGGGGGSSSSSNSSGGSAGPAAAPRGEASAASSAVPPPLPPAAPSAPAAPPARRLI